MGKSPDKDQPAIQEPRAFAEARAIDMHDERAMQFWAEKLGVSREELSEVVKEVGPNLTAVALKIEAPMGDHVTASPSPRT